jgi:hypothetical protein
MAYGIEMRAQVLEYLAFSDIDPLPVWTAIGTEFDHPMRIIHAQNLTDSMVVFSFDGVNEHFILPQYSFLLIDVCSDQALNAGFFISRGTQMYVAQATGAPAPTTGNVYITAMYSKEG